MTYDVLFLDIDGTILSANHTVSDSTKEAIAQVQQQGVKVFLATGRPLHEIRDLAKQLNINAMIGYNGALAIYKKQVIVDEPMNGNTITQFIDIAKENKHEMVLFTGEGNYFTSLKEPVIKQFVRTFQLKNNKQYTPEICNSVLGITLIHTGHGELKHYKIGDNLRFSPVNVKGAEHSYDMIRENVNKGSALKRVLEELKIPMENAIAFGDGMNDKEMLQAVGEGFAMGNADPDLFAYANRRTSTVSNGGIFNGLKELGLVK